MVSFSRMQKAKGKHTSLQCLQSLQRSCPCGGHRSGHFDGHHKVIRGSPEGHQGVTRGPRAGHQGGHQVEHQGVTRGRQGVTRRSPEGHQGVTRGSPRVGVLNDFQNSNLHHGRAWAGRSTVFKTACTRGGARARRCTYFKTSFGTRGMLGPGGSRISKMVCAPRVGRGPGGS